MLRRPDRDPICPESSQRPAHLVGVVAADQILGPEHHRQQYHSGLVADPVAGSDLHPAALAAAVAVVGVVAAAAAAAAAEVGAAVEIPAAAEILAVAHRDTLQVLTGLRPGGLI